MPLVGTWIEILQSVAGVHTAAVVPLVGTWIEMLTQEDYHYCLVVPLVGTWIEMPDETPRN